MEQHRQRIYGTIAIVAPVIAREGISKQVANQIKGLQQEKVSVCLIVLAHSDVQLLEEYGVDMSLVPTLQLYQTTAYLSPGAFAGSGRIIWPILRYLKKHAVASVVVHAPYAHFVMRLAKLAAPLYNLRFTLIQYFHGLQYSEYPLNTIRRYVVNSLNKWLAKRSDDAHVSVSKVVQQEVRRHLINVPNNIVLYNSITSCHDNWSILEEQAWQQVQPLLQESNAKFKILLPNRIDHNKGQLFFLNVLERFLKAKEVLATEVAVFIVGDGPQRQEVEEAVRKMYLEKIVTLTGALPNAVVQQLMQRMQLVVVPSFKEGLPFSVLEALKAKCVVLASKTGGIPEMLKDRKTGFLFEPGNSRDCLEQLSFIYNHRNETLINGSAIDAVIQRKFSLKGNTEKLLHLITTIHK